MAERLIQITLEIDNELIFYHWNYSPKLKNIGGSIGWIYPKGSLHNLTYNQLLKLGNGQHTLNVDESVSDNDGREPNLSDDDRKLRSVKFYIFGEKLHCFTLLEVHCVILQAFSPKNAKKINTLLTEKYIKELKKYAKQLPNKINEIDAKNYYVFNSYGSKEFIPIENLNAIKKWYL